MKKNSEKVLEKIRSDTLFLNEKQLEQIEKNIEIFFKKIGYEISTIEVKETSENTFNIDLQMSKANILIGKNGKVLEKIQLILFKIFQKKIGKNFFIFLDINNYKRKKVENFKKLAYSTAIETIKTRKEKFLPPMPPFLRRIIHIELSSLKGIKTKSIGKEPKKIVITME